MKITIEIEIEGREVTIISGDLKVITKKSFLMKTLGFNDCFQYVNDKLKKLK